MSVMSRWQSVNTELAALTTTSRMAYYIGWTGYGNLGDEVLYQCIQKLFRDKLFLYDKPYIGRGMSRRLRQYGPFDCTMLGGGTLLYRSKSYLNLLRQTASRMRVIFGSGVANAGFWEKQGRPIISDQRQEWVDLINDSVDYIGVRGPVSAATLKQDGVVRPVEILGDPVLFLSPDQLATKRRTQTLGINVGHSNDLVWGGSDRAFLTRFESILKILVQRGWKLVFFPVWDEDVSYCEALARAVAGPSGSVDVRFIRKSAEYLRQMEDIDVFIGEKLHSVVLAACSHTPVIMMEYRPKCFDFMASLGLEAFTLKLPEVTAEALLGRLDLALANYDAIRRQLCDQGGVYKARLLAAADRIFDQLEKMDE